jgi:hypothetical protein
MAVRITKQQRYSKTLKPATIRDFSGGWNVLDDDLNLSSKFSTQMENVYRDANGSVRVRNGTSLFVDCSSTFGTVCGVVNIEYFADSLVVVGEDGTIVRVLANGTMSRIWDTTVATALSGSPAAWGTTSFASFAQFNGNLIIANGVDKPLIITEAFVVDYLQDPGTGSNLNTPIAKYVTTAGRYLLFAGDPVNHDRVHISARDACGVFFGDPAPNDATFIDVGSILPNATDIRGIASFRQNVIVTYTEGTIIGTLGTYDGTDHTPIFDDAVAQYGAVSHRSIISYGDDTLMMDLVGVPSLKRTVFTGTLRPERVSDLVDPHMTEQLNKLSVASLENRVFSVYHQREGQFMFFVPDTDDPATTTQTYVYAFIFRPNLNTAGWALFTGWKFTCATRTQQGSLLFGDDAGKIWLYNPVVATDYYADASINSGQGVAIDFVWELPWADFGSRMQTKTSKYIAIDTRGAGAFTVEMFVDRFMTTALGVETPLLSMSMIGADAGEQGGGPLLGDTTRNAGNMKLYSWPAKFELAKLRISGQVTRELRFISITLMHALGSIFR